MLVALKSIASDAGVGRSEVSGAQKELKIPLIQLFIRKASQVSNPAEAAKLETSQAYPTMTNT